MSIIPNEKRSITPEMAVKNLKKSNVDISEDRAKEVLDLLYILAQLTVKNILKEHKESTGG